MGRDRRSCVRLSIVLSGDEPPHEFRVFSAGKVETTKGTFIFDEVATKSVMAEYQRHGADLMIDYDHASLGMAIGVDPALAGRAAGWFSIEVRDGELWATNVRWTPPAAEALKQKEWRYMSPAFELGDDERITKLLNVALTNLPATRGLEPLMAANAVGRTIMAGESGLSPKLVGQALEAVASKDAKAALDLMKQILAALLGGEAEETPSGGGEEPAPMDPAAASASLLASAATASAFVAAGRTAMSLTGLKDVGSAMAELKRRSEVAIDLEKREAQLASDRATLESGERRTLVASLVKLGYEIPALAWSDDKGTVPSDLYAKMPIDALRERVKALSAKGARTPEITPPSGGGGGTSADGAREFQTPHGVYKLSAQEIANCEAKKIDLQKYAATRAAIKARSNRSAGTEV